MKITIDLTKQLISIISIIFTLNVNAQEKDSILAPHDALKYRNVGPARGGRVTTVAGSTNEPGVFYMGATGGGVWKTSDYGQKWTNISDGFFSTPSIGAIRVAPSDSSKIFVGTGSDGIRSNVITGKGVYKSEDAGKTWEFVGLKDVGQIGAVEIHPQNPDTVFVAAIGNVFGPGKDRGVYRTFDGGENWENILFISDSVGASDLELSPDDPNTIYAGMWQAERKPWTIISGSRNNGGVFKSTDGGSNWVKITKGLPSGLIGKIDFAVSAANPDRVWALIEAPQGEGGIFRSDDRGDSWELVNTKKQLLDRPFYYCNIDANPQNADNLYVSATQFWKSSDGGKSWEKNSVPHGDNHGIWMNPTDSLEYIQANDGGANVTRDGGKTWSTQRNQSTAELYQVNVDDQFPYWLYAGQQDNSTIAVPSLPPYNPPGGPTSFWMAVGGCETGPAVPKPGNPDIVYSNCKGRFGVYNKKTGQEMQYYVGASNMYGHNPKDLKFRFQRVSPIHVSPHNPNVVYHASQYLHKTIDDGKTWEIISPDLTAFTNETQVFSGSPITRDITGEEFYSTIYSVNESKIARGLIWVGANDGPVSVTRDGGESWNNVTPADLPKGGRVNCVEPSPHQEGKAYFATYRYLLNDWHPYIYKTIDYGSTWTLLTPGDNGIPADYPTRVIREDPNKEGILYAGTDFGMFISFDDGTSWTPFQKNLPVTPITDIKIHRGDLVLSTMGRGFWIMDDINVLYQAANVIPQTVALYKPTKTYRLRYRSSGSKSVPYYPSNGVKIDYYIPEGIPGYVQMDIYNEENKLVRTFTSKKEDKKEKTAKADMGMNLEEGQAKDKLTKSNGANRFTWDLKHTGPYKSESKESGRPMNGPMVAPGKYRIELKLDNINLTEAVDVITDPRVSQAGVSDNDLKVQESLALSVRDLISEARIVADQVARKRESNKDKIDTGKASNKIVMEDKTLEILQNQLVTMEGRYMTPMLIDQLSYLYFMIIRADQMPGQDAFDRYNELSRKFEGLKIDNEKLIGKISKK